MKVLHVIPSVALSQGGPSLAVSLIASGLSKAGVKVDVATTDDDGEGGHLDVPLNTAIDQNGATFYYFRRHSRFYKASWSLTRWLSENIQRYDLLHIHALFSYSSCAAAHLAIKKGVPYIVRPLGVLNRWGMENRRKLLKRFSFRLIEQRILRNASAIHYTSRQEKSEAEQAGATTTPVVIPLGIDLSDFESLPGPDPFYAQFPVASGRKTILFLSRLDAKKGLDLLLPAFAEIHGRHPEALLVIAGSGEKSFVDQLHEMARRLAIDSHIVWAGFLNGQDKLAALAAASFFTLPSYSENFGLALVEALAAGLPCVVSDQIGIASDVEEFEAGLRVPCEVSALAAAFERLLVEPRLCEQLSINARRLANNRFSPDAMISSLVGLYNQVLAHHKNAVTVC
jgi:glycosyltransferase involved in cell wall biosynthesis